MTKLYGQLKCPKCAAAKEALKGQDYEYVDMDTIDGRADGLFYDVMSTPTVLIFTKGEIDPRRFVGEEIRNLSLGDVR